MMNNGTTFVGFGLGAIQSGLFLYEGARSGNFKRLVVAEVMPDVVQAVRANNGFALNVATAEGIEQHPVTGIEIYNPLDPMDRPHLVAALAEAQEMATALPSVAFYDRGEASVAALVAEAVARKLADAALPSAVLYTAENNNHAAEILDALLRVKVGADYAGRFQVLNTVVGKMSGVVVDAEQIREDGLARMTPGADRAFLVEAFNRILITKITLPGFVRGLGTFVEKTDLLPFEEAKLYGHNATHALLGYLANEQGLRFMSDAARDPELIAFCRAAFIEESGQALIRKHAGVDELFTEKGFQAYADDLLARMLNPYLRDQVARIIRDPRRKLAWDDRLIGTMRLALSQGLEPLRTAAGAKAALRLLETETDAPFDLAELWPQADAKERQRVLALCEQFNNQPKET
jgi:mannitol-1-phosphate 5-dehydrogenase